MPIVKSMIRNLSSQKVLCSIILVSLLCFAVLCLSSGIFRQVLDFRDVTSLCLLCFGVVSVAVISNIIHLLLLSLLSGDDFNILNRFKLIYTNLFNLQISSANGSLLFCTCLFIAGCVSLLWLYMDRRLKFQWDYPLVIFSASIFSACMTVLVDYDDIELSSSQNIKKSIGSAWAYGAYSAFYEKILKNITRRMSNFENKKGITLLVRKLVIICPLSCNANGSLEGKDGDIEFVDNLEEIIDDEGANINRILKTNVYKICGPFETYIAAEIPSPLATLYEMRDVMDAVILQYHRKCFIQTLKDLTKSCQCVILEYDDLNNPEPLHSFLLSKLGNKKYL